ncbi:GIY-YIG nuclease family protein [Celeribacter sp. SCSIO 80788]|uniref:GIY-YIG nuclease family protein n=1 Tax=Celeribacter sp. SCSIO 80788 TaxID=3117013 RepID=UPI003DA5A391
MSKGYVYILSNPSMPGLVKIGMTTRDVEVRAAALHTTGVPTPFKVEHEVYSPDCEAMELRAHEKFHSLRVNDAREFFKVRPSKVIDFLENDLVRQVLDMIEEFLPDHILVRPEFHAGPEDVFDAAQAHSLHPAEVGGVLSQITAEEMAPLVERYRALCAERSRIRRANIENANKDDARFIQ